MFNQVVYKEKLNSKNLTELVKFWGNRVLEGLSIKIFTYSVLSNINDTKSASCSKKFRTAQVDWENAELGKLLIFKMFFKKQGNIVVL